MSQIIHYGNSLDSGHYFSDIFDVNTGIWWHCDDDEINKISDFPEGVYNRESHKQKFTKKKVMLDPKKLLLMVYIIT